MKACDMHDIPFFPAARGSSKVAFFAGATLLAIACGLAAVNSVPRQAALMATVIFMPFVLIAPLQPMLVATLLTAFVGAGMVEYFLRFEQMHWVIAFLFMALLARFLVLLLAASKHSRSRTMDAVLGCLMSFCGAIAVATVVNRSPLLQTLAGVKAYALPLGLSAVVACTGLRRFWFGAWRAVPLLMIVQLPVALVQHLFYVKEMYSPLGMKVTWDAVVGTFGGNPEGGGASGALALFLCFGAVATATALRAGIIGRKLAFFAWLSALGVMALAEIKVVIILMPFAILIYKRRQIFRSPLMLLAWSLTSAAFVAGLLLTYSAMYWRSAGQDYETPSEILAFLEHDEGNVYAHDVTTGEVSRIGALFLWWRYNVEAGDIAGSLFGHGPASSKISVTFGYGQAARLYPFNLNTSSLSALLWDLGLFGALSFAGMLLAAACAEFRAARSIGGDDVCLQLFFETVAIGALLLLVTLPYNLDAIETPAIQALLAVILGLALTEYRVDGALHLSAVGLPHTAEKFALRGVTSGSP